MFRSVRLALSAFLVLACYGIMARAAGGASFTVAATDVLLATSNSSGTSNFTLTSVGGYAGTVLITCSYAGPPTDTHLPTCGGGAIRVYRLQANQSVKGTIPVTPFPVPSAHETPSRTLPDRAPILALAAGALLLVNRRFRRFGWVALFLLGTFLVPLMTACGGGTKTLPYTVTATDTVTQVQASTGITITVR